LKAIEVAQVVPPRKEDRLQQANEGRKRGRDVGGGGQFGFEARIWERAWEIPETGREVSNRMIAEVANFW
jgi:hypothetical protein